MTFKFNCPKCHKSIKATSEVAGKVAKCPGCGSKLRIPSPEPAVAGTAGRSAPRPKKKSAAKKSKPVAPPVDDDVLPFDEDEWDNALNPFESPQAEGETSVHNYDTRPQGITRSSFTLTRVGLMLVYGGLYGIALCILLLIVTLTLTTVGIFAAAEQGTDISSGVAAAAIMTLVLSICVALSLLVLFLGPYFCISVPSITQARTPALYAAISQSIATGIAIAGNLAGLENPTDLIILKLIGLGSSSASYFYFLKFMTDLATFIKRYDIAELAKTVTTLGAMCITLQVVIIGAPFLVVHLGEYGWVLGYVVAACGLAMLAAGILAAGLYGRTAYLLSKAL